MRSERMLLAACLAVPVLLALVGWPAFLHWAMGPSPQPTPQVAGAAATSGAEAQADRPAARPTEGVPATVVPQPVATKAAPTQVAAAAGPTQSRPASTASEPMPPAATAASVPQPAAVLADDPSATVESFYSLVGRRQYSSAAQLWTRRMQANFPPAENIDRRFSQTRSLAVQRADLVSQDAANGRAAVAVDVLESTPGGARHWVGTWYLVHDSSGWLLDQPQLESR